mmetsp:Transcript_27875/g.76725  ORF Transcript_27875/g.76725 Transcript_27875/m.76725 type:complete len:984 (-) Transcript_27875:554-3505(-)
MNVAQHQKLREKREKKGECPHCGIKLYKVSGVLGKKRVPLTIKGHVEEGRCLTCNPPPNGAPRKSAWTDWQEVPSGMLSSSEPVPEYLHVPNMNRMSSMGDDASVISGITLDRHLVPHDEDSQEEPIHLSNRQRRGDADSDRDVRPKAPTRVVTGSFVGQQSLRVQNDRIFTLEEEEVKEEIGDAAARENQGLVEEQYVDSPERIEDRPAPRPAATQHEDIVITPETLPPDTIHGNANMAKINHRRRIPKSSDNIQQVLATGAEYRNDKSTSFGEDHFRTLLSLLSANDVPELNTLEEITKQLWKGGKKAKILFSECNGYQSLTQIMWANMVHEPLEEKAVELFLSTVVTEGKDKEKDDNFETTLILATEGAREATEALLFVMQSLSHNKAIQMISCRALVCLASASGMCEGQVDDGSNSGAAAVVINSMAAHGTSVPVQKWCLRALFELCSYSANAEANKRILLTASNLEGGGSGLNVVLDCIEIPVVEAVRLVWCLSANDNKALNISLLERLVNLFQSQYNSESADLVEATLGAINNLYVMSDDRDSLTCDIDQLVQMAYQSAKKHKEDIGLCTEAFAFIANVAAIAKVSKDWFAHNDATTYISSLIIDNDDDEPLHEECCCALLSLALGCPPVKASIRNPSAFLAVKRLSRLYESSARWQELLCTLISSVVVTSDEDSVACEKEAVGVVCFAMTLHSDVERVQEPCCVALRNISNSAQVREYLMASDATELVLHAIKTHDESKVVVLNGSELLWNVGFTGRSYPEESKSLISSILKAMRGHLEDIDLLNASLGVLLRALVGSEENKRKFCEANGIEVATCVMVMHGETEQLLIKSCGILGSLSCSAELVPSVVAGGGVTCTIDAIRGGRSCSTDLLLSASQFLTNACLAMPDQCEEAGTIVPVLIDRMSECPQEVAFQSEACRFLWALTSLSETARAKILELDGVSVLMAALESSSEPQVQSQALEAFNELAVSSEQPSM